MNPTTCLRALCAISLLAGCTATTAEGPTKAEAERLYADGRADGADFCEELGWYGDDICDSFCPLEDQDCTGAVCTVGANSTCPGWFQCLPGACYYCGDEECCSETSCQPPELPFCRTALCPPGTVCDEELATCVPERNFCDDVFCPPGTVCVEEAAACLAPPPFCPEAFCGPGTVCNEDLDRCVPIDCPILMCALHCEHGFVVGPDGCSICVCAEPS